MRKNYTTKEKDGGEFAVRRLSHTAQEIYYGVGGDLGIFEIETENGIRYDTRGIIDLQKVTFEELQAQIESYAKEINGVKYELTDIRQSVSISGETLYKIKALRDFTNEATGVEIKAGQLGGYVQSENNLSHSGTCWVDESARVFNNARVTDDAYIGGEAMANKDTVIKDSAIVTGAAWITQSAKISGNAYIRDMAFIKGEAEVSGTAEVTGHHTIGGNTILTSGIHNGAAAPTVTPAHSPTMEM